MRTLLLTFVILFFLNLSKTESTNKTITSKDMTDLRFAMLDSNPGFYLDITPKILEIVNREVPIPKHRLVVTTTSTTPSTGVMNNIFLSSIRNGELGLIGPTLSNPALILGMTSTSLTTPMIVFQASSATLVQCPYLFRTCPNGKQQAYTYIQLCKKYQWNDVVILASTLEFALALATDVMQNAELYNIRVEQLIYFTEGRDLRNTLFRLRNTGSRIIILMATAPEIIRVISTASKYEMTGKPYVYLITQVTTNDLFIPGTVTVNETLAQFFQGVISVSTSAPDQRVDLVRELFPHGANQSIVYASYLMNAFFAYAHACKKLIVEEKKTVDQIRGINLINALSEVSFQDPTLHKPTPFYFNSSGEPYDARFTIYNFQPNGSRYELGINENGKITYYDTKAVWPIGFDPDEVPNSTPVQNISYFSCEYEDFRTDTRGLVVVESPTTQDPTNLQIDTHCNQIIDCKNWADEPGSCTPNLKTGYVVIGIFIGIGVLFLVFSFIMILIFRRSPRIRATGPIFLLTTCVASCTGIISVFFTYGKPNSYTCMSFYWFLILSASVMMGSLLAKQYRVWKVFGNKGINPVAFTELKLVAFTILISLPDIIILVFWSIFDPPKLKSDSDSNVRCESDLYILFYVLVLTLKGIVALGSLVLAILSRKFPSAFSDARLIGFSIYNECLIGIISIPLVLGLEGQSSFLQWIIQSLAIMIFFLLTFGITMVPKIYGLLVVDQTKSSTGSSSPIQGFWKFTNKSSQGG